MSFAGFALGGFRCRGTRTASAASYAAASLVDVHEGAHVEVWIGVLVHISGI